MHDYMVDGVSLRQRDRGWFLTWDTLMPAGANMGVTKVTVPGVDGAIPVRTGLETGQVSIQLVIRGDEKKLTSVLSFLTGLLTQGQVLTRVEQDATYETDIIQCVLAEPDWSTPSSIKLDAQFTISPWWMKTGPTVSDTIQYVSGSHEIKAFSESTAAIIDGIITITGTVSTPTITNTTDGTGVQIRQTLGDGQTARIDIYNRRATVGGSPVVFDYPPEGFITLTPKLGVEGSTISLELAGSQISGAKVKIEGHQWVR